MTNPRAFIDMSNAALYGILTHIRTEPTKKKIYFASSYRDDFWVIENKKGKTYRLYTRHRMLEWKDFYYLRAPNQYSIERRFNEWISVQELTDLLLK